MQNCHPSQVDRVQAKLVFFLQKIGFRSFASVATPTVPRTVQSNLEIRRSLYYHLRHDRITEEDTPTRQALKRVPLALLTPSHGLEAARDVQRIARLGSNQTCADSFFVRKLTSVANKLTAEALSPVGGVDHEQIQRPGLRPRAGPVVAREGMGAFEDVCCAWVRGAVYGFVCELSVRRLQCIHRTKIVVITG